MINNLVQPLQNQDLVKQQEATQNILMKQAVSQMPQSFKRTPVAQQMGAQMKQAQGQAQVAAAKTTLQQQGQQAGAIQQQAQFDVQQSLKKQAQASQTRQRSLVNQLGAVSNQLKQDLFDRQVSFQKDELGRTYWNDRQLADWKIAEAKSDEELAVFEQQLNQEFDKKMALLQTSQASIRQRLAQEMQKSEQDRDQALTQRLAQAEQALKEKMAKAQRRAQQNAQILSAAGTIIGAGAGALIAGPGGYAAGATLGGTLGGGAAQIIAGAGGKVV